MKEKKMKQERIQKNGERNKQTNKQTNKSSVNISTFQ